MEREDCEDWLVVLRTPGAGPATLRAALAEHGGSAAAVRAAWRGRPPTPEARSWLRQPDPARLAADRAWLAGPNRCLLCCVDADFPPLLERIGEPPAALFVEGDPALLLRPQVAIVGARGASAAGRAHAGAFARVLARAGFVVTSGLAEGIDGAAHAAALEAGEPTVAVVGTGPDRVYPPRHRGLAARIGRAGALVSEFPPGTPPRAHHFPLRNRLLAGLALGTLVIEAGLRSGSLITARLAAEQGREVFALPGSVHHALARGCHRLIRDGAALVETPEEVAQALVPHARALGVELASRLAALDTPVAGPPPAGSAGDRPERQRLDQALGHDPVCLDELVARTGLAPAALVPLLLELELDGRVENLAGNRYQRVA